MAKNKKRRAQKPPKTVVAAYNDSEDQLSERLFLSERIKSFRRTATILLFICFLVTGLIKLHTVYTLRNEGSIELNTPNVIFYFIIFVLIPYIMIRGARSSIDWISKSPSAATAYKGLRLLIAGFSIVLGLGVLLLLYDTGAITYFAKLLYKILPALGTSVSNAISQVFGWVISGVAGNIVYDFLKNKFASPHQSYKNS